MINYFQKGRKFGIPGAGRKKSPEKLEAERQARLVAETREREKERAEFEAFEIAEGGVFNGFLFAKLFHEKYKKEDAIGIFYANDTAEISTPYGNFRTGGDGKKTYLMSKNPKKKVEFNRSVYLI